ncbi:MAG: malonyl-ACP O-methyltransferase BioC [Gammaproteobacteria bacterium]|nr:malonyl-ACP O-methyltransferase BioC [Gammaproteobacteria bacterium]
MNLLNPPRLDKVSVKKSFNRAAKSYNRAAILQEQVLQRLLQRLQYIRHQPQSIIDIGCGTGKAVASLSKRYPKAKITCIDLAFSMLHESRSQFGWLNKKRLVNGDMECLPFADNSFDLLFSSLALQWANDLPAALADIARIGRPQGLLMFATFGFATLSELRDSWRQVDQKPHVHQFIDMHDIGDALIDTGFSQPVVDAETIRLEYDNFRQLLDDLKNIGASNADRNRERGLMTPSKLGLLEESYRKLGFENGKFVASYEVVYGHAWL